MRRFSPRMPHRVSRIAIAVVAGMLVAGLSGCHWFGKKNDLYTSSSESRPLEVPPDLDRPAADNAMALPSATSSVTASSRTAAGSARATPIGFNAPGDRDAVFARVGDVLTATSGVTIASKAQVLGTYDVAYMGTDFLVRVTKVGDGTYISAVDPRGLPPAGEGPTRLIAALKAAIAP